MAQFIDAKGQPCPTPVIMAKKAISDGSSDFSIEVDNSTAVENLKRLADNSGFSVAVSEAAGVFTLHFLKSSGPCACAAVPAAPLGTDYAVFIGRDIIGAGDRELGTNLMRMFFYTLSQSDQLPSSILFMNAGARLPACDDQVVQHLKVMAEQGVEILVCGTCLSFYGLSELLRVGIKSNMYDIVTKMQNAAKVITI